MLARADVDVGWLFALAVLATVCGVVGIVQNLKAINLVAVGLTAIGVAGMLAWWP
jgi:hypothetical protein